MGGSDTAGIFLKFKTLVLCVSRQLNMSFLDVASDDLLSRTTTNVRSDTDWNK